MGKLYGWVRQFPVIGFNSGRYDINVIKQFMVPYFLSAKKKRRGSKRRRKIWGGVKDHAKKKKEKKVSAPSSLSNAATSSYVYRLIS
ncbi:MAG: hypothetical protein M3H12_20720 [Chromatiales bacterium]